MRSFLTFLFIVLSVDAFASGMDAEMEARTKNALDSLDQQRLDSMRKYQNSPEAVEKVAKEYEAILISKMLKDMHSELEPDPIFGGGQAEEIYRDMMMDEYGKIIAEAGGIGVAESIKRDMNRVDGRVNKEVSHDRTSKSSKR